MTGPNTSYAPSPLSDSGVHVFAFFILSLNKNYENSKHSENIYHDNVSFMEPLLKLLSDKLPF